MINANTPQPQVERPVSVWRFLFDLFWDWLKQRGILTILGLLLMSGSLFLMAFEILRAQEYRAVTQGVVIKLWESHRPGSRFGGKIFFAEYSFSPGDSQDEVLIARSQVKFETFQQLEIGGSITVHYKPDLPQETRVEPFHPLIEMTIKVFLTLGAVLMIIDFLPTIDKR